MFSLIKHDSSLLAQLFSEETGSPLVKLTFEQMKHFYTCCGESIDEIVSECILTRLPNSFLGSIKNPWKKQRQKRLVLNSTSSVFSADPAGEKVDRRSYDTGRNQENGPNPKLFFQFDWPGVHPLRYDIGFMSNCNYAEWMSVLVRRMDLVCPKSRLTNDSNWLQITVYIDLKIYWKSWDSPFYNHRLNYPIAARNLPIIGNVDAEGFSTGKNGFFHHARPIYVEPPRCIQKLGKKALCEICSAKTWTWSRLLRF